MTIHTLAEPITHLDTRTLARRLGLSPGHLANLRSAGKTPVPYLLLGSAVRYRLSDVEAYEASSVVVAVA